MNAKPSIIGLAICVAATCIVAAILPAVPLPDPPYAPGLLVTTPVTPRDSATLGVGVSDPDHDSMYVRLYYDYDRDTMLNSGWLGPIPDGETIYDVHRYGVYGAYAVAARAMDVGGLISPLSDVESLVVQRVGIGWRYPRIGEPVNMYSFAYSPALSALPNGDVKLFAAADGETVYAFIDFGGAHPIVQRQILNPYYTPSCDDAPSLSTDRQRFYLPSDDFYLYCLRTDTLVVLSTFLPDTLIKQEFMTPAVVPTPFGGDYLYVGRGDSVMCLLDSGNGQMQFLWSYRTNSEIMYPLAVNAPGDRIFFGNDTGQFICLDNDGSLQWQCFGSPVTSAAAIDDSGIVYVGREDGRLYGYSQTDTSPVFTSVANADLIVGCPVIDAEGKVYVVREDATVEAYTGAGRNVAPLWAETPSPNVSGAAGPCLAPDTTVIIHTEDDWLFALRLGDGSLKWQIQLPLGKLTGRRFWAGGIYSSPTVGPAWNRIYVGSNNEGVFYAITVDDSAYAAGLPSAPWPKFQHDLSNSGWKGWSAGGVREATDTHVRIPDVGIEPSAPSPFSDQTRIRYHLVAPGSIRLAIYDAAGRLIKTLARGWQSSPGEHHAVWNATDEDGRRAGSGLYFCRLETNGRSVARSLILLRSVIRRP